MDLVWLKVLRNSCTVPYLLEKHFETSGSQSKIIFPCRVDFFSLDIEGLELDVLKTIPFDKVDIKVFLVEVKTSTFSLLFFYNKS